MALVIAHAKRMRRVVLSAVSCSAVPHFPTLSHKRQDFREKIIEHKICLICSTTLSEKILILRRIQRGTVINVHRSSCNVLVTLVGF